MSFEDAVPVSSLGHARVAEHGLDVRRSTAGSEDKPRSFGRQRVNISEDTLMRKARANLARMVDSRLGYTQTGALSAKRRVGGLFSAEA